MLRYSARSDIFKLTTAEKRHYKLYKKGRLWVTAGVSLLYSGVILGQQVRPVAAAETDKPSDSQAGTRTTAGNSTVLQGSDAASEAAAGADSATTSAKIQPAMPIGGVTLGSMSVTQKGALGMPTVKVTGGLNAPVWGPADFDYAAIDTDTVGTYPLTLSAQGLAALQAANPDVDVTAANVQAGTVLVVAATTPTLPMPTRYSESAAQAVTKAAASAVVQMNAYAAADRANAVMRDPEAVMDDGAMSALETHMVQEQTALVGLIDSAKQTAVTDEAAALSLLTGAFAVLNNMNQELVQAASMLEADQAGVQADVLANAQAAYTTVSGLPGNVSVIMGAGGDLIVSAPSQAAYRETMNALNSLGVLGAFRTVVDPTVGVTYRYVDTLGNPIGAGTVAGRPFTNVDGSTVTPTIDAAGTVYLSGAVGTVIPNAQAAIPGYTFVGKSSDNTTNAFLADAGTEVTYTYKANAQTVKVTYFDDTANHAVDHSAVTLTGATGAALSEKLTYDYAAAGFAFDRAVETTTSGAKILTFNAATQQLTGAYTTSEGTAAGETQQTLVIHLKHRVDSVDNDWTVTRTINYLAASDQTTPVADPVKQTVTYTQTALMDQVTHAIVGYDLTGDGQADLTATEGARDLNRTYRLTSATDTLAAVPSPTGEALIGDHYANPTPVTVAALTIGAGYQKPARELVVNVLYERVLAEASVVVGADTKIYDGDEETDPKQYAVTLASGLTAPKWGVGDFVRENTEQEVGSYEVTLSDAGVAKLKAKNPAFVIEEADVKAGFFTITPAPVTVAGPTLGKTYDGKVYKGDDAKLIISGRPAKGAPVVAQMPALDALHEVGTYSLTPTIGDNPNYTITSEDGALTIFPEGEAASFTFVDGTANDRVLENSGALMGESGTPITYDYQAVVARYEAAGYKFSSTDFIPGTVYDHELDEDQHFTVTLVHDTLPVTVTAPGDADLAAMQATVTRTIEYAYADGSLAAPAVIASVDFVRTGEADLVTGHVTWNNDWTPVDGQSATFAAVLSPTLNGFTAAPATVPAKTVTADGGDLTEVVIYTAETQTVQIHYIDVAGSSKTADWTPEDGTQVVEAMQTLTGESGATYTNRIRVPHNYVQVAADATATAGTYDHDAAKTQHAYVYVTHATETLKPGTAADTAAVSLTTVVTQTITYRFANGTTAAPTATAAITFTRTAEKDLVTGAVRYPNDWVAENGVASFAAVASPVVAGYQPDLETVQAMPVTANSVDVTRAVVYRAAPQTLHVHYIDVNGKTETNGWLPSSGPEITAARQTLTGATGSAYTNNLKVPDNYRLAAPDAYDYAAVSGTYDSENEGAKDAYVYVVHRTVTTTATAPRDGDPARFTDTITRTVHYVYEDGTQASQDAVKQAIFYQTGTEDLVTKETTWNGDWATVGGRSTFTFEAAVSPVVAGFLPDQKKIAAQTVAPGDADLESTVTYSASAQTVIIHYVDVQNSVKTAGWTPRDGREVTTAAQVLTGGSNTAYTNELTIPAGYVEAGPTAIDAGALSGRFDSQDGTDQHAYVYLHHDFVTVTPEAPRDADPAQLQKAITQTVAFVYEDGATAAPKATTQAIFTQGATEDLATGKVTYDGEWTLANGVTGFAAVSAPVVPGFLAATGTVPAVNGLTVSSANVTKEVMYKKLGAWIPTVPGRPNIPPITYPNDPVDASRPMLVGTANYPTVPYLVGYNALDPQTGNALALVDPTAPEKGYLAPAVPSNPGLDTPIAYTADANRLMVRFVDDTTGMILATDTDAAMTEGAATYTPDARIKTYTDLGYTLVTSDFPEDFADDEDVTTPQSYTVHLRHQKTVVSPAKPVTVGRPINAGATSARWPAEAALSNLKATVTAVVNYRYADGQKAAASATDRVIFARTVTVDNVTGAVLATSNWTTSGAHTNPVASPVITGYLADKAASDALANLTPTTGKLTQTVTYTALGAWVIQGDTTERMVYPNAATDASQTADPTNANYPTLPYKAGYTPLLPDGSALMLVDATAPAKGYRLAPVPQDPSQDTIITYGANGQTAQITYLDETTGETLKTDIVRGTSENAAAYSTQEAIASFVAAGYELVRDDVPTAGIRFDEDDTTTRLFTVGLKHGQKHYGIGNAAETETEVAKNVTQTIHYLFADGTQAAADQADRVTFSRTVVVDTVTGEVLSSTDWAADRGDAAFSAKTSPVVSGYLADAQQIAAITGLTETSPDVIQTVTYAPVGRYVLTGADLTPIPYPNDPHDAAGILAPSDTSYPIIPAQPGYAPTIAGRPLSLTDPAQPQRGYRAPAVVDATKDTIIAYEAAEQALTVTYIDDTTGQTLSIDQSTGVSDGHSTYTTEDAIAAYLARGYVLVEDGFPKGGITFDDDTAVTQAFEVHLAHGMLTLTAANPGQPGQPINPASPTGPKYADSFGEAGLATVITQTVNYVDPTGEAVRTPDVDRIEYTRTVTLDTVTGNTMTTTNWVATNGNTTFAAKIAPVIPGYLATAGSLEIPAVTGVTRFFEDGVETITYTKLGAWVTNLTHIGEIGYPNDPKRADRVLSHGTAGYPVIPYAAGYTPEDGNGHKLAWVDAADQTKGYVAPAVPSDPSASTQIVYMGHPQTIQITYVDDTTDTVLTMDTQKSTSGLPSDYTTEPRMAQFLGSGYRLIGSDFPTAGAIFGTDDDADQAFTVHLAHRFITVTADTPAKPGTPIDAAYPNGPIYPDGVTRNDLQASVKRTIQYRYDDGDAAARDVVQTLMFKRTATVDAVTSELTYSPWATADGSTVFAGVISPIVNGYTPDQVTVPVMTELTPNTEDSEVLVTYRLTPRQPNGGNGNETATKPEPASETGTTSGSESAIANATATETAVNTSASAAPTILPDSAPEPANWPTIEPDRGDKTERETAAENAEEAAQDDDGIFGWDPAPIPPEVAARYMASAPDGTEKGNRIPQPADFVDGGVGTSGSGLLSSMGMWFGRKRRKRS